jgi:hypothetical protein
VISSSRQERAKCRIFSKFEITWLDDRSEEAVLDEIRRVAALEPNRRLTVDRFDDVAKIKSTAVRDRFGSWGEATRRAGLSDVRPLYTREAIVEDLRRVSALLQDEPFTISVYSRIGRYSASCIKRQFGGWREALGQADLGDRYVGPAVTERMKTQVSRTMTDDEILEQIRNVAARLGKPGLSGADIEANSEIKQSQMYRRFGSVSAALKRAGVEQVSHGRRYTEDEIFENLLNVWTHFGRPPAALEMDQLPSTVGKNAYIHRYGGWRKALKAFVERANSEADDNPTPDSERHPSTATERTEPTGAQRWEVKLTRVLASHGTPRRPFGPKTGAIRALVFDSKCLSATCSNVCCAETTRLGTRNASYMLTMVFRGRRAARLGKTTCAHCARRAMSVAVTASQTRDFKIGAVAV